MDSRRAWAVLLVAMLAYIIGVLQRSSMGVAGVAATERFLVDATALSSLAVLQLLVYALLQIPVGVLVDRFGPRVLILTGALTMAAGQLAVAVADDLVIAIIGRVLVGAGDAMTFISVLRLLGAWFSPGRLPQLSQWVGTLGQSGQLLSAIPFAAVLQLSGWTAAFASAASLSVVVAAAVLVTVRDAPAGAPPDRSASLASALSSLRASIRHPGTRLGFWAHAATQSSGAMLALLWGFPMLSIGLGYGPAVAAGMIGFMVVVAAIAGPIIGLLSARFPFRRSNLVLGIVGTMALAWTIVLLWPGIPPFWMIVVLLVGVLLDLQSPGASTEQLYAWERWRLALAVQGPVVGLVVGLMLIARRRTRRRLQEEEGIAVGPLWLAIVRRWRGRREGRGDVEHWS
ncbi:MFS transporter [Microcella humidisoli]|uniref:MFS transporter n=1 Tax=Microcella humidisoli TaxID=2963406 RepID=A0ABY5FVT4_9MICO|nr:MFS transporter [Microcella humidisoli]UTT62424.1 MFS transporter [Microcella humidisoli]